MSISTEITRITEAKADIVSALAEKGVTVSDGATISDMGDYIRSINTGGEDMADYVVEQGTNGNWKYRKWNSGVCECWGTHSIAVSSTGGSGTFYYAKCYAGVPSGMFNAVNHINYSCSITEGFEYCGKANINDTFTTITLYPLSNNSLSGKTGTFRIQVIGTWE